MTISVDNDDFLERDPAIFQALEHWKYIVQVVML